MIDLIANNYRLYTEQEILDNFPKENFYVVFGSSHSAGWCDNGQERIMDRHKNWPSRLETLLGKPVFNLAMGSVMPQTMLEIVCDFAFYYTKQNKKCLGAFIEPRSQDFSLVKDQSADYLKQAIVGDMKRQIDMFQHHAIALGRDYYTKDNVANYYNVFQLARQLNAGRYGKYKNIDKNTEDWVLKCVENQFMGGHNYFDCLNILLRMTQVLHSHNIPNYTFYWEEGEPELEDKTQTKQIQDLYYSTMAAYNKRGINYLRADNETFLHRKSFNIIQMVRNIKGNDFLEENKCKCKHYNTNVSKVIADILYEKIK